MILDPLDFDELLIYYIHFFLPLPLGPAVIGQKVRAKT